MNKGKTIVIIINWNGWKDTLNCCNSLKEENIDKTDVLIFDNGSTDCSVCKIAGQFVKDVSSSETEYIEILGEKKYLENYIANNIVFKIYKHPNNMGFAKAINLSTKFAKQMGYSYLVLLNNDTVIETGAFRQMLMTLDELDVDIVIPQIRYLDNPDVIWNCGGHVNYWGRIKYWFACKNVNEVTIPDIISTNFATGCCMMAKVDNFINIGGFTEKFFFGEEDVELSLRLKRLKRKIVCDTRAVIYHKVGASIKGNKEILSRKAFIHYLNRLINMRDHMPPLVWYVWRIIMIAGSIKTLKTRYFRKFSEIIVFVRHLFIASSRLKGVSKDYFQRTLSKGVGFGKELN